MEDSELMAEKSWGPARIHALLNESPSNVPIDSNDFCSGKRAFNPDAAASVGTLCWQLNILWAHGTLRER